MLTVASNAGHCLWSGIVPPERAKKVVERLMAPDMWTGWGIRTLSAEQSGVQSLQLPNRLGLAARQRPHRRWASRHYGFGAEAARIAHDISVAASHFPLNQLPELYTAFERDETTFPVQYIGANVPQAWAAGSAFMLTQAMLGFLPDAPRNRLYVDPSLPKWLPDLAVHDLRVGKHKIDIRFWREDEQTAFEVIEGDPKLVQRCELASKFAELRAGSDPINRQQAVPDLRGLCAASLGIRSLIFCCVHQRQVLRRGARDIDLS